MLEKVFKGIDYRDEVEDGGDCFERNGYKVGTCLC